MVARHRGLAGLALQWLLQSSYLPILLEMVYNATCTQKIHHLNSGATPCNPLYDSHPRTTRQETGWRQGDGQKHAKPISLRQSM